MKLKHFFFIALFLTCYWSSAQTLAPNYRIKVAGKAYHRLAADGSGNTYVYGSFDDLDGKSFGRLLKLDASGKTVPGFQNIYADNFISAVLPLPDNKVLISGYYKEINGEPRPPVLRLNADGTIDETFQCPLLNPANLARQSNGQIIVFSNGVFERLNPNGNIDQSFKFQNYAYTSAEFAIAPDNSIYFSSGNKVFKLNADGEDDYTFSAADLGDFYASALTVQSDGKVLVGATDSGQPGSKGLVRLNTDGTLDNTFNDVDLYGQIFKIVQRANGKILIAGQFTKINNQPASLVELNSDGTLSKIIAIVTTNWITTVIEHSDSKITIAGEFFRVNGIDCFGSARFNANYTRDDHFAPKITFNNCYASVLADDAMRAKLVGQFDMYGIFNGNAVAKGSVFQVAPLGTLDASYKPNIGQSSTSGSEIEGDGKLYAAGWFSSKYEVLRLNVDGSRDNSFNIGTGATRDNQSAYLRSLKKIDDKLFVSGDFTHFNGSESPSLVALNENGSVAQTFKALPPNSYVHKIVKQSNGKLILLGNFLIGPQNCAMIRLNTDGSIDESFHRPIITGIRSDIVVDNDNNIYLSGDGSLTVDGGLFSGLVKFTPDGYLDDTFNIGSGFKYADGSHGYLFVLTALPNGNVAVGGFFDTVQGVGQSGFAIVTGSGMLVPQQIRFFGNGSCATNMFYKNGQLFLAGRFHTTNYKDSYGVVKVLLDPVNVPSPPLNLDVALTAPGKLAVTWKAGAGNNLAVFVERATDNMETFTVVDTVAANVTSFSDDIAPFQYKAYRLRSANDAGISAYSNIDSLKWSPAPEGSINLTVAYSQTGMSELTWADNVKYHDGYFIERSSQLESGYQPIDTLDISTKTFSEVISDNQSKYYRVIAYNSKGKISSNTATLLVTDIEVVSDNALKVYPNPAVDYLEISTGGSEALEYIAIVDQTGRTIKQSISLSENQLNVSDIASGAYFLRVKTRSRYITRMFVKK